MCTAEEVKKIVADSEKRMEEYVNSQMYKHHQDVAKTVSNQYREIQDDIKMIKNFVKKFEHLEPKELEEITKFKQGVNTAKNILIGTAILVGSIGAIATGFIALIKSVK